MDGTIADSTDEGASEECMLLSEVHLGWTSDARTSSELVTTLFKCFPAAVPEKEQGRIPSSEKREGDSNGNINDIDNGETQGASECHVVFDCDEDGDLQLERRRKPSGVSTDGDVREIDGMRRTDVCVILIADSEIGVAVFT